MAFDRSGIINHGIINEIIHLGPLVFQLLLVLDLVVLFAENDCSSARDE